MHEGLVLPGPRRHARLKWHCLRRRASDPPFFRPNLVAGLAVGASMEVDLRRLADGNFACLHDAVLESETDGSGLVSEATGADLARVRMRGSRGARPLLLDELTTILAEAPDRCATGAILQLDLKDAIESLGPESVASFREFVEPVVEYLVLSSLDWSAAKLLSESTGGIALGFDPLEIAREWSLTNARSISRFADVIVQTAPEAEWIYLYKDIVRAALACDANVVEMLQAHGKKVDCWTVDSAEADRECLQAALEAGCDQITTNTPLALAANAPVRR